MSEKPPLPPIDLSVVSRGRPHPPSEPYQMAPVSDDEEAKPRPDACVQCGSIRLSTATKLPVCEPCRMTLVRFPFPLWVKAAAALVALMVMVSLALSRERIANRLHLAHAEKMLHQQKWEQAYQDYQSVIDQHGDTKTLLNYAEAAAYSGHLQEAVQTMQTLSGRSASWEEQNRAQSIDNMLQTTARQPEPQQVWQTGDRPVYLQPVGQLNQLQIQPNNGQLNGFQLQQAPSGSLNNVPIHLQTR